jgi:hypothetical protein
MPAIGGLRQFHFHLGSFCWFQDSWDCRLLCDAGLIAHWLKRARERLPLLFVEPPLTVPDC